MDPYHFDKVNFRECLRNGFQRGGDSFFSSLLHNGPGLLVVTHTNPADDRQLHFFMGSLSIPVGNNEAMD